MRKNESNAAPHASLCGHFPAPAVQILVSATIATTGLLSGLIKLLNLIRYQLNADCLSSKREIVFGFEFSVVLSPAFFSTSIYIVYRNLYFNVEPKRFRSKLLIRHSGSSNSCRPRSSQ
jgi:hypothetical protein